MQSFSVFPLQPYYFGMNLSLVLIIFLSTTSGLLIGYLAILMLVYPIKPHKILGIQFQGVLPRRISEITAGIAEVVITHVDVKKEIRKKFINNAQFEKMIPEIEVHIDDFLRHRLGKKMPMIGMFIGENTIRQLKQIFMEELNEIFPSIMLGYMEGIGEETDLEEGLCQKLNSVPVSSLMKVLSPVISNDLRLLVIICGLVGLLVGILQVLIVVFIYESP